MRVGNIDFVAWTMLSDAFENLCTLLYHTYDYNGQMNGTLSVQYGNGEEYDLTIEEYEKLEKKFPNWSMNEIITFYYEELCKKHDLMLIDYDQLEQLEELYKKKAS